MRETTVLCEVVCGAEPAEAPNGADFALRRDDELCAHDGESRIGVFDASESDGRTRHARRGRLHKTVVSRISGDSLWAETPTPIDGNNT